MKKILAKIGDKIPVKQTEKITSVTVNPNRYNATKAKLKRENKTFHDLVDVEMQLYLEEKNKK